MKKNILIVDDEEDIRYSIIEGMKSIGVGYVFQEAKDGYEAIEKLNDDIYDLILLDIMMPKMDGMDCADKLKVDPMLSSIPILFLSAKTDECTKALARMKGEDYMEKPFEIGDLKIKIDEILQNLA